jgi:hypothetical protein
VPPLVSDFGADLPRELPPLEEGVVRAGGALVVEIVGALVTGVLSTGVLAPDGGSVTDV